MKKKLVMLGFVALVSSTFLFAQSQYKLISTIPLDGSGGWDYLRADEVTNRLFVSHDSQVHVIDLTTGKQVGVVPNLKGVHGIAIANDLNKAFISCGRDSSVVIVDLKTLQFIAKVKVTGANPDAIFYDDFSHLVLTYNGGSANATVLDGKTHKVLKTIPLDGKPEFSVSDGAGKIFVNNEDKSMIYSINTKTLAVENKWSIAPGEEPSGLATDRITHRLFSVTDNLMVVLDSETGKVVTTVPIGDRVDGVMFDPEKKRIYTSNGTGTVTVVEEVNANTFKVVETIPTRAGARTIGINTKTHRIYLPALDDNKKFVVLEIGYAK
ncbi:MAG TPA: YncE family protein [Cyclobacteriaceae bacterium]|nr:YncE family protein [Cyclobacteriaceae bacterium]